MTHTAVQNDASTNKVAKLSYQVRGPFRIVKSTVHGIYLVRKLYKHDSPELKFMATDLYFLPPSLKPCVPVDSSDIRYLNHSYSPIVNPLTKLLNIDLYNNTWFDKPPQTSQPLFHYNHPTLSFPDDKITPFTSLSDLYANTNTIPPSLVIDTVDTNILSPPSPLLLSKYLSTSDGLFFIRYIPKYTFKQRWFLVQINHVETSILNINPATTGDFHVTFLTRHTDDKHLCDNRARWWPEWHEYQLDADNVSVYGARMLFSPKRKPNLKKNYVMVRFCAPYGP